MSNMGPFPIGTKNVGPYAVDGAGGAGVLTSLTVGPGVTSLDAGRITTDGAGDISVVQMNAESIFSDGGAVQSDGVGNLSVLSLKINGVSAGNPSVTNDNTTTVTFATDGTNQTRYDTTATLAASLTIALPSGSASSVVGQILRYVTNRAVTTVTVTGTVAAGPALTTFAAAGVAAWQAADTAGTWIRIQ